MNKKNACEILDLPLNYTPEQLKKQYHIKALRWHPDKNKIQKKQLKSFKKLQKLISF